MEPTGRPIRKICCIGAGYVVSSICYTTSVGIPYPPILTFHLSQGGPTSAVIAQQNPHIAVTVVDLSESRIAAWKSNVLPIYEPGINQIVQVARDGSDGRTPNLFFSTDISTHIDEADLIFIAVNTPTKQEGLGAGSASDLAYVESAARHIAQVARSDKIIVEKSTVPCGTADSIREILDAHATTTHLHFDILSNPEFLAEGTAVADLLHPDRILIGSARDSRGRAAAAALADVYAAWVPRDRIITINLWSSELAKLAANCLLAQRISSINALSAICEATGADIAELSHAVGRDSRLGPRMLHASAGFGGSCFKKDVLGLAYVAGALHLPEVAAYWRGVVELNEYQKARFAKRIVARLYNTLRGKRIAVLGFAYKKNTADTRESAAITIVGQLIAEGATLAIYDPQVAREQIVADLTREHPPEVVAERVVVCTDAAAACVEASAVVILTEWDHFRTDHLPDVAKVQDAEENANGNGSHLSTSSWSSGRRSDEVIHDSGVATPVPRANGIGAGDAKAPTDMATATSPPDRVDWYAIARTMKRPRLVFDGRNVVDGERLAALGFTVECIGKATQR